jgi:D-threonate/D-erythronate kinase
MPRVLIVADDLTGAADTGACFAARGLSTAIPLQGAATPDADVVVLSTETRDLDGKDAARVVSAAVARHTSGQLGAGARWIYKKIDSALRGNPRQELLATLATTGENRVLVAPAFPAEGRTTVGGRQVVHGVPVAETPFGEDSAASDLVAMFANGDRPRVRLLDLAAIRDQASNLTAILEAEPAGIIVADAETDDDLYLLARATSASSLRMLCGTAGFARALAGTLSPLSASSLVPIPRGGGLPVLVVAGSQHDATRRQIDALAAAGMPLVRPTRDIIDGTEPSDGIIAAVMAHLASGQSTVLTTAGLAASPLGGRAVAERLAQVVASPRVGQALGGLVLTGGDVAAAVLAALETSAFWLGGEIAPGQPWGVLEGGSLPGLPVATKAGSFGGDDALLACIDYLTTFTESR